MLLAAALAALLAPAGCAQPSGQIATIDVLRIQANWPKFINYQNQLAADAQAIDRSSASPQQKQRAFGDVRAKSMDMQNEIANDLHNAAQQVADQRHFTLVVTRQFVGYGGVDITPDVEKILKITEASPPPKT